ncbi:hypothetical protein SLUN_04405 [Streptomyces lunaelactis]|uniref:Secreted protein n=1 Tax=Streptomyces lunaelactis TaxID=1535768 RepID=A0A2R4SXF4_9ACTN|nr:hypothetical protein [Streptomyces lunaelactis]AVZ71555.1 hypothetical protein SLUN_04405 [Streptomyces lunaelactis]NUK00077.1 hypothetical protein [Streptomyces lunaelactis]NUK06891.1 hypothetical protein [Streptomyces lunaelactis]NUK15413.1 hypothetical protein [Streptomyces lunaelactis]NUK24103.1 hypothetical protein [Streptomyces lunaelactis]
MIKAQRVLAVVALAAGASALAAPAASAAVSADQPAQVLSVAQLDELAASSVPPEHRAEVPSVSGQLGGLGRLNQTHQLTDQAAPVTGLLPAVR